MLAQVLGVKEATGEPLLATVCKHLRGKESLLVLDNCEHLFGASADLVDTLLRETARGDRGPRDQPRIAACREPATCSLGALLLPDPKSSRGGHAPPDVVRLFVDRARQHRPRSTEGATVAGGGRRSACGSMGCRWHWSLLLRG